MAYQESNCASTRCERPRGQRHAVHACCSQYFIKGRRTYADRERPLSSGARLRPSGKTVKIGAWACPIKWETPSEVASDPPGPRRACIMSVHVPNSYAVGYKPYWSPFVLDAQTLSGSIYGGQSIVLTGAGFRTAPSMQIVADRDDKALKTPVRLGRECGHVKLLLDRPRGRRREVGVRPPPRHRTRGRSPARRRRRLRHADDRRRRGRRGRPVFREGMSRWMTRTSATSASRVMEATGRIPSTADVHF